jgi:predicted RNase H-like HicB family nuclease
MEVVVMVLKRVQDMLYRIKAEWDIEDRCWIATSDDLPGLVTGADSLDELVSRLRVIIPDFLDVLGNPTEDVEFVLQTSELEAVQLAA